MHHIPIFLSFSECEQAPFWSQGLISQPSGYFPKCGITANFTKKKKGKQQRSASALPSVTEWLDSRCCWQPFYSETTPPCRLCGGSPVCCVGALPPGHSSAKGILHTIALLFGCHVCTVCIWPHSNAVWIGKLWRFCMHGLQNSHFILFCFVYLWGFFAPHLIQYPFSDLYVQINTAK